MGMWRLLSSSPCVEEQTAVYHNPCVLFPLVSSVKQCSCRIQKQSQVTLGYGEDCFV
jgi:hypothetical protein